MLDRNLEGDVAEFGSFKGQSGYLIARYLEERKSDKRLFMFDAFESLSRRIDRGRSLLERRMMEEIKKNSNGSTTGEPETFEKSVGFGLR